METDKRLALADQLIRGTRDLTEEKKVNLIKSVLSNYCGLTDEEVLSFTLPSDQLTPSHVEDVMRYASAEAKVERSFNGAAKHGVFSEDPEVVEKSSNTMKETIKAETQHTHNSPDISMFIDSLTPMDGPFLISEIVGSKHPLWRRIRNAYIPGMVGLVTLHQDRRGNVVSAEDKSGELFDGNDDAVSVLENLIGDTKA